MKMHVVYNSNLTLEKRASITLRKPALVLRDILSYGAVEHVVSRAVNPGELLSVHQARYIDRIMEGRMENGFGNTDEDILMQALWANGAMLEGVKIAKQYGNCLVPASGFHHAGYDHNWGFCTFNGMMLAAVAAGGKVLIIDGDAHEGDGCLDIILKRNLSDSVHYRQLFTHAIDEDLHIRDYDFVIYQPGADSVEEGPMMEVNTFRWRDWSVFNQCIYSRVPILWCLGGGYDSLNSVVEMHSITSRQLKIIVESYSVDHPDTVEATPGADSPG